MRGAFGATWRGVSGGVSTTRRRIPVLDHAIRAYGRYASDGGDRLAAGVTYFAFLSFFPIIALVYAAIGFVVDAYPDAKQEIVKQINGYLPGLADKLNVANLGSAKFGVGLIGLVALLLAGVACVSALRDAIRLMWHQSTDAGNLVTRRLRDVSVLLGLGLLLIVSLVLTSFATSANGVLLRVTGLEGSSAAAWLAGLLGFLLALIADTMVFLYLFWRLPKETNRRAVVRAALLGAVGLEVFKLLGTWLVGKATGNPVYGTFAVIVGLLIWINILMRWILFAAAWAVTAPGNSDIHPSGTASQRPDAGQPDHADQPDHAGQPDNAGGGGAGEERGETGGRSETDETEKSGPPSPDETPGQDGGPGQPEPDNEPEPDNRRWVADRFRRVVPRRHPGRPPGQEVPSRREQGDGRADATPEKTSAAPAPGQGESGRP
ncbi:YhjD/YihY/BrkB family envelope integrity protein [Pseudofrankia sp. BMG5.37]|uniref:YhjD/YihY/BrkB family envelope integrity protein n=1 Tax=Pseudofrankia sp. BMG5.36 TaxID=1834512 RepID=UPI001F527566|nr:MULTISPECIES: YhjD/YihY/BrkB family envelope integrity protein [unclassified Pseudofrankia]MDT3438476.1 YhjD/YihY/BrkB family envelope integrity protein [Pseudofrankia sp. BMG5.37]